MTMEADGSSGNFCGYCNKVGHQTDECRERASDRRLEVAIGCAVGILLVPFAILGYMLGAIASCIWGGIRYSWEYWPNWVKSMRHLLKKEKS